MIFSPIHFLIFTVTFLLKYTQITVLNSLMHDLVFVGSFSSFSIVPSSSLSVPP